MAISNSADQNIVETATILANRLENLLNSAKLQFPNSNNQQYVGKHNFTKAGKGSDFWQFREYSEGDSLNKVSWRKSAKTDRLIVKEFETQKPLKLQVWINSHPRMAWSSLPNGPTKGNYAMFVGLAIVKYLAANHEMIAFLNSKVTRISQSNNLAAIREAGANYPQRFSQGCALLICDGLDDLKTYQEVFEHAQKAKCQVILLIVKDKAEREFDFAGQSSFALPGDDREPILIHDCQNVAAGFRANYDNHFAEIERLCARSGFAYLSFDTNVDTIEPCLAIIDLLGQDTHPRAKR